VKSDLARVAKEIKGADLIGLMTHQSGDGDAFGALLGLRNILEKLNKKIVLFSNEPLPKYLEYLGSEVGYQYVDEYRKVDLLIGLDLSEKKRFTVPEVFDKAKEVGIQTLVIDHHTDGEIHTSAEVVWQKTDISSTAEMVYWLAVDLNVELDKLTAQLLLWGIETDTYFLSNPNVFESTETARADLLALGAKTEEIKENVKLASPTSNEEFMKVVRSRTVKDSARNLTFTYVTSADKERYSINTPVSSAVANLLDYQEKSGVVLVAEQRADNIIKISMRSNHSEVDVAEIAKKYGGGGHVKAAGFEIEGKVEDFINSDEFSALIKRLRA
jgi:phosphoesterase RecJ-like protein